MNSGCAAVFDWQRTGHGLMSFVLEAVDAGCLLLSELEHLETRIS